MQNEFLRNKEHLNTLSPSMNIFYRAVIYNNNDPEKLGRCQVRILGIHDESEIPNDGIVSDHLPWAELLVPLSIVSGGNSGIGLSSVPINGSWVWVFFDNGDWNKPVIVGMIEGKNTERRIYPNGFRDKNDTYPLDDRLGESDINRLARNEKVNETIVITIRDANRDIGITDNKGNTWDELKEKTTSATYPKNTVLETIGGSFIEYDSTGGNERIHTLHESGTYHEIQNEGDYQFKCVKNSKYIVDKNDYSLIKKKKFEVVRDDVDEKYDKNIEVVIGKDKKQTIKGNLLENVLKNVEERYDKNKKQHIKGNYEKQIDKNFTSTIKQDKKQTISGSLTETVNKKVKENYNQGQETNGGPEIKIKAGIIYLN